ncbi:MAG TPA: hypothetical protein VLM76_10470 [Patescibacteria group bacterium]|nr:hypothetical protein [Patescibacteria group bacterium]
MAADPDPYFALPKLYGGSAYSRPPRPVPDSERPFDLDDLPIVAGMTEEERAFVGLPSSSRSSFASTSEVQPPARAASASNGGTNRFSLRGLVQRLGPRPK